MIFNVYTSTITSQNAVQSTWRGNLADVVSAIVTQEHNGVCMLEMVAVANDHNMRLLSVGSSISAPRGKERKGVKQTWSFIIDNLQLTIDKRIHIIASDRASRVLSIPVVPFTASKIGGTSLTTCLSKSVADGGACVAKHAMTILCGAYDLTIKKPRTIKECIIGSEGSLADKENKHITIYRYNGGELRVLETPPSEALMTPVEYAVNMSAFSREIDYDAVAMGKIPYWASDETGEVVYVSTPVKTGTGTWYLPRIDVQDMSSLFETKPTQAQLKAAVSGLAASPTEYIKAQIADYPEAVFVDDTVPVVFDDYNIRERMTVTKTVYDVIQDRYLTVELGDIRRTLPATLADMAKKTGMTI